MPAIERTLLPTRVAAPPVDGVLRGVRLTPCPTGVVPEIAACVTRIVDEFGELTIRHLGSGDSERLQRHPMRPFLVVEDERIVA